MKVNTCLTSGLVGLTALSFLSLTSSFVFADSVVTTTTINVPESCTMSGTGMTSHTATLINGTYSGTDYSNGIGTTTVKVFCNDSAGFAIYAIGYTNDEYGNNKLHWSEATSTSDTTHDINTAIYDSSTTTDSTWSMKLDVVSGTYPANIDDSLTNNSTDDFSHWHTVPTEYKRVAYRLSGTDLEQNGVGEGSSITTTYDAYISQTQPAGTYTGQVKYTLVHPSSEGAPEIPVTIDNIVYMQDLANITPAQYQGFKDSMTEDQQYQLIDVRDGKTYYLAKLKDGNVWMTQNLDLDLTDSSIVYNNTTTDLGWNSATSIYGTASWTPSCTVQSYEYGTDEYAGCTDNNLDYYSIPRFWENGDYYWDGPGTATVSSSGNAHYHVGNNYNWTAAIAMNDSSSVSFGTIIEQSICPAGWTLPRADTYTWWDEENEVVIGDGSFNALLTAYGLGDDGSYTISNGQYNFYAAPIYSSYSFYHDAVVGNTGSLGRSNYWLSTTSDNDIAYSYSEFNGGYYAGVQPSFYGSGRQNDYAVRCIVRDPGFTLPGENNGD